MENKQKSSNEAHSEPLQQCNVSRRYYNCSKCGGDKTVEVITKETKQSMSVQINKCTKCKHQWGIKHLLNNGG